MTDLQERILQTLTKAEHGENDPRRGTYPVSGDELLRWIRCSQTELNAAVKALYQGDLVDADGYPNGPMGRGYVFDTITLTDAGRVALSEYLDASRQ